MFCCFVLLVDCKLCFIKIFSSSNKVYVDEGVYFIELLWDYYIDGEIVIWVDFMFKSSVGVDVFIVRKFVNQ